MLVVGALSLGACGDDATCQADELVPQAAPRLVVVMSDYASSAVAIVDDDGSIASPWLDSGTRPPELVAALSGDVVAPHALEGDALLLLDRYQTDVLTVVPFAQPEALWQADLRGGRASGASPNPQDLLVLPDGSWLVSRFNPAEDPGAPELARGNDLVRLDHDARAITSRLSLDADVSVEGVTYFARPSGLALLRDGADVRVLVGLGRLSSLVLRRTGPGAVALLDPATGARSVLELDGLSNCTAVAAIPDVPSHAIVLCRGDAFGEDETHGGLVEVALSEGVLVVQRRFAVADDATLPPPSNGLVPLEAGQVAYVSSGSLIDGRIDVLAVLDLERGVARVVAESSPEPFALGEGVLDAADGSLLVPDANARAVRRFSVATFAEGAPITLDGACAPVPPRQVVLASAAR